MNIKVRNLRFSAFVNVNNISIYLNNIMIIYQARSDFKRRKKKFLTQCKRKKIMKFVKI